MPTIKHNGKTYKCDERGFLEKFENCYDSNWADYVKGVEGLKEITDDHQKVINALRTYYKKTVSHLWYVFSPKPPVFR